MEESSDPLSELKRDGGVTFKGGSCNSRASVRFEIELRTKSLMIGAYSEYQNKLSELIINLRDRELLTFKAIAYLLISRGFHSPRGLNLGAESVFSIYKKRKLRDARLKAPPKITLKKLVLLNQDY
jgi:hypothetical protein